MLVVLFVISLLLSILVPSLGKVRRHARALHSRSNLREIARAVNVYAVDNNDWYPPSVATNGPDVRFLSWTMPNRLVAVDAQGPRVHRSISAYLGSYVGDVEVMQCPNAPRRFRYLQDAWDQGDAWDNPDNGPGPDELRGSYCMFWDYRGYMPDFDRAFRGAEKSAGQAGESTLLATDYFAFDHRRHPNAYASCEKFAASDRTIESSFYPSYWQTDEPLTSIRIRPAAAYIDGHVEPFDAKDIVEVKVAKTADGRVPFADQLQAGTVLIPRQASR